MTVDAFCEGVVLMFSPFSGFWRTTRATIRRAVGAVSIDGTAPTERGDKRLRCHQLFHDLAIWYDAGMVRTFERAIAEVAALPDADQEEIGRQVLSHIEKLRRLREELDKGVGSLDSGRGTTFSIEEFIRQKTR